MKGKIIRLPDGLRLVHKQVTGVRSVGLSVMTAVGSNNESAENNGISHFLEHMFFKGTNKRSAFEIADEVDAMGAQINAFTSKLSTCFYTLSMDSQLEACAEILSDILFSSTFDETEAEREKGVVCEEISMSEDDNADLALDMLAETFFAGNSLARPILGTRANVRKFRREDLLGYIEDNYCAENTVVTIVGNIEEARAIAVAENYFAGRFRSDPEREWADKPHVTRPGFVKKFKDIEQSNLALSMPGYSFSDPRDVAVMLVNNIVGGNMSSRLFQEIREKQGLAYNVYTYPSSYINNGLMTLYIGTNPDAVERALGSVARLFADLRENGLTEREFEKGKTQLKGTYVLGQESTGAQMRVFARYALYNDELFDIDGILAKIDALRYEEVNAVAREIFDLSKASISYVGREIKRDLRQILLG